MVFLSSHKMTTSHVTEINENILSHLKRAASPSSTALFELLAP